MSNLKIKKNFFFNILPIFNQSFFLKIIKNQIINKPIFLLKFTNINIEYKNFVMQNFVFLEQNSVCSIIDIYISINNNFYNDVQNHNFYQNTFVLNNSSVLNYNIFFDLKNKIHNNNHCIITGEQKTRSSFLVWAFILDGHKISFQVKLFFIRKESISKFNCLKLAKNNSMYKFNIESQHIAAKCKSDLKIRGIITGHAKVFCLGKIKAYKYADDSLSDLQFKNMLLSKYAHIESRPSLEIYNDNIICTHGSAISYIDNIALHYMQSRGINLLIGQKLLLISFIFFILDKMIYKSILAYIKKNIIIKKNNAK